MSNVDFRIILAGNGREQAANRILESMGGSRTDRKVTIEIQGQHSRERGSAPDSVALAEKIPKLTARFPSAIFAVTIKLSRSSR